MSLICFYWLNQWAEHKGKNFGVMESYNLFYYFTIKQSVKSADELLMDWAKF